MLPDISVVMSVYNNEAYLEKAITSILLQDSVDFEFIIVNDGSTDNSYEIIKKYAEEDSRIKIINQENQGLTRALINGCAEAGGKIIVRQDADDISYPGRFKALKALIESDNKFVMVSSWSCCIGPQDELIHEIKRPSNPVEATEKLMNHRLGPIAHGSMMFLKSAYEKTGGYRKEFFYGQDTDLWLRLGQLGLIAYTQSYYYAYRVNPESISFANRNSQRKFGKIGLLCHSARQKNENETQYLCNAEKLTDTIRNNNAQKRKSSRQIANGNYFIGRSLFRRNDNRAIEYFYRAVKIYPLHWRAWLHILWINRKGWK